MQHLRSVTKHSIMVAALVGFIVGCAAKSKKSADQGAPTSAAASGSPPQAGNWQNNMDRLATALADVIPQTINETYPDSMEDREKAIDAVKRLRKLSHQIDPKTSNFDTDPRMFSIANQLQTDLDVGLKLLETNQWRRGIRRVALVTESCVACHTSEQATSRFSVQNLNGRLGGLSDIQRGDYYVATRQFDSAIKEYEKILADPNWAKAHRAEWNGVFVKLLAITIRVKSDPSLSMELISRFIDSGTYPEELKATSRLWRHQARDWRANMRKHGREDFDTAQKLLDTAEKLTRGKGKHQFDGLVLYLRGSRIMNNLMITWPREKIGAKQLYYSGLAEEGLSHAVVWAFPDAYFERCANLETASAAEQPWIKKCEDKLDQEEDPR